jgi:hypothetical protein|tara:strand:- start:197 stop:478 length:282 start_codon:yes stop_codon:yes gene_type:complete
MTIFEPDTSKNRLQNPKYGPESPHLLQKIIKNVQKSCFYLLLFFDYIIPKLSPDRSETIKTSSKVLFGKLSELSIHPCSPKPKNEINKSNLEK